MLIHLINPRCFTERLTTTGANETFAISSEPMELPNDTPTPSIHPEVIEKSSILVDFSGPDDKLNSHNWSNLKKSVAHLVLIYEAILTFETQVLYFRHC